MVFLVLYFGAVRALMILWLLYSRSCMQKLQKRQPVTLFILSFFESPCIGDEVRGGISLSFFIFTGSYHSALLWQPWRHHHRETIFGECHLTLFAFYCSGGTRKKRKSRHSWRAWRESKRLLRKFLYKYHYDSASSLFCCLKHSCTVHPNF